MKAQTEQREVKRSAQMLGSSKRRPCGILEHHVGCLENSKGSTPLPASGCWCLQPFPERDAPQFGDSK